MAAQSKLLGAAMVIAALSFTDPVGAQAERAWIKITDQPVSGSQIKIDDVSVPADGWIVVHAADQRGEFQENHIIGHFAVKSGVHHAVNMRLDTPVNPGQRLFVTLHEDNGIKGRFEFDAAVGFADDPFRVSGVPVASGFQVR